MRLSRRQFIASAGMLSAGFLAQGREKWKPFRFVQLADTQLGMGGYAHDVDTFNLAVDHINRLAPDFVVICGDLVNEMNDDQAFADFNAIRNRFDMPCYCVPGNHDVSFPTNPTLLARYRKLVGQDYYMLEHEGCTFAFTNTQLWKAPCAGESERHHAWFVDVLQTAARKNSPVFVSGHIALYEKNMDEKDAYFNLPPGPRKELLALFKECGVVAYLTGHAHKQIVCEEDGVQLVSNATTSRNFDGAPMGFRMWHAGRKIPCTHEYIAVEGASPPAKKK
jgi:predicted MPP superfamily phosphohydrolase